MNKVTLILILILVAAFVGMGYFWGRSNYQKSQLELVEKTYEEQLEKYQQRILELQDVIDDYGEEVRVYQQKITELSTRVSENQHQLEEARKKLREAPPEHLIQEARRILQTKNLRLTQQGVEFSLSAFRETTIKLLEWENFSLKREPLYREELRLKDKIIATQKKQIDSLLLLNKTLEGKYSTLESLSKEWKEYIVKRERRSRFSTFLGIAGGVCLGFVLAEMIN